MQNSIADTYTSSDSNIGRIESCFNKLQRNGKKAFLSYIMCGDPDLDSTLQLMHLFANNGVDAIELGIPFSDPTAEGPVIQKAAKRAIDNGIKPQDIFEVVATFRQSNKTTPVILMGYYNIVFKYGVERFCRDAKESGVDGFIIVDLPIEEEAEFTRYNDNDKMPLISLATPVTDIKRAKEILAGKKGFVYFISVKGVTGHKEAVATAISEPIEWVKQASGNLPVCIGFGITSAEKAREMSSLSDGVVIGSQIVRHIENYTTTDKSSYQHHIMMSEIKNFVNDVRRALDE